MTQPAFYITGNRMFNTLALFTSVDWLLNIKSVEVQSMLLIYFVWIPTKMLIIYFKSSGRGNRLGFAPSSQSRALCALHRLARSVRYPDSLRSIRMSAPLVDETKLSLTREGPLQRKIRFWCQKLHKNVP